MRLSSEEIQLSRFLSKLLRHAPESIGLSLDRAGWVSVETLLDHAADRGLTLARLERIVVANDKQRFAFSGDRRFIRANQGHSIPVELGLTPLPPPALLFHGSATANLPSILREGLQRRSRHHVHLSCDLETAVKVGARHGEPVVLKILAGRMAAAGIPFYCSANNVWLTDAVAPEYLSVHPYKGGGKT